MAKPNTHKKPGNDSKLILRCPQCGGEMEVHFVGALKDKRAICTYCKTAIDIPDSYQRIKKKRSEEWNFNGMRAIEDTVIETRQDGEKPPKDRRPLPPEVQEILQKIEADGIDSVDEHMLETLKMHGIRLSLGHDSITPEVLQALKANHVDVSIDTDQQSKKTIYIRKETHKPGFFTPFISFNYDEEQSDPLLSPAETIKFFGVAPAPEDTRKCPNPECGATIPKNASKCSWCGKKL